MKDDAISRQSVLKLLSAMPPEEAITKALLIQSVKQMDAAQPERKRGYWVGIDDEPCETWECDKCGYIQEFFDGDQPNYCPNCGADMREVDDE